MEVTLGEGGLKPNSRLNYFQILNRMLVSPGQFFAEELDSVDLSRAFGFLFLSSLFFTLAGLSLLRQNLLSLSILNFLNAVIMPFMSAAVGYVFIKWLSGQEIFFKRLVAVYALSSGLMMLISWIPLFVWITEPWKWFLIWSGLVKGCGLGRGRALSVIALSFFVLTGFFWSMNGIIFLFR